MPISKHTRKGQVRKHVKRPARIRGRRLGSRHGQHSVTIKY